MKCFEIRFDNGNVMFVRDSALMENIQQAVRLSGGGCHVNKADIGDEIIAPVRQNSMDECAMEAPSAYRRDEAKVAKDWR